MGVQPQDLRAGGLGIRELRDFPTADSPIETSVHEEQGASFRASECNDRLIAESHWERLIPREREPPGSTTTAADRVVDPPLPMQVMLYVVLTVGEINGSRDARGREAVRLQAVGLVDDHESVDAPPEAMLVGFALNTSVGAVGDTAANIPLRPPPGHVVVEGGPATTRTLLLVGPPCT